MKELQHSLPDLVEHVPAVVFRFSHREDDWRTWFVTQNISMYGYAVEDFMSGQVRWMDIVHPDDRVLVSKTIADYEQHNVNAFRLYYRLIQKNGNSVPVTEYNQVNRDDLGNIVCYDTSIVANNLAEESRRVIDDHYRQQVVLNDILMSLHDSNLDNALQIILDRTGEYLDTSRALLFKDSPDHKTCKIVYEWCNRDIDSVMALDYSITYATGMPEIYIALQTTGSLIIDFGGIPENCREEFEAEGLVASAIFAVYLGGDHYGFVCFDDCIVERQWDDDTVRFLKNISNMISTVLARQESARQLNQSRRAYEAVLNNVDSYIFVTDAKSERILFANRAFKEIFGENCEGQPGSRYLNTAKAHTARNADEYPEIHCNLTQKWLSISVEEIHWVDGERANLYNCYDITAKKVFSDTLEERIEERTRALQLAQEDAEAAQKRAEDAAQAKSQFLANMSHEMRTPMNAIIGMTNIYKTTDNAAKKDYCVDKVEEASKHLLDVINDILDMSKIEAGKLEMSSMPFHFERMLMRVTNVLAYSLGQKSHQFSLHLDPAVPAYLISDEQRIAQVITNLMSNAVKFTPENGKISLTTKLVEQSDKACTVEIAVTDNGIGLSKGQQEKLFRSFEQADAGISRKYGGTGLGLAISKRIADMLSGDIVVKSVQRQGSTFRFTFRAGISPALQPALSKSVNLSDVRILVVDDAADVREYFRHLAEISSFRCDVAADGQEAMERILSAKLPYHIVFLDWHMPKMNGIELAEFIQKHDTDAIVVMISAFEWSDIETRAKQLGIERFIAKPLFPSAIMDTITECLGYMSPDETVVEAAEPFEGKRLLLAEDVEINREIVQALLEPMGLVIDCVENGRQAVERIEQSLADYDAILMDIHMPEMDGYEATRQIRAMNSEDARQIPIIAMTANVFKEDIERCIASGMNDHVGKPLDIDDVVRILRRHLH